MFGPLVTQYEPPWPLILVGAADAEAGEGLPAALNSGAIDGAILCVAVLLAE